MNLTGYTDLLVTLNDEEVDIFAFAGALLDIPVINRMSLNGIYGLFKYVKSTESKTITTKEILDNLNGDQYVYPSN